jgi:hypothetical protein
VTERYAQGLATEEEMREDNAHVDALKSAAFAVRANQRQGAEPERIEDTCAQADLLREVFGNPFRPVTFSPEWRTDTALSMARQMYDSGGFSAMPILADALQDSGWHNEDILNHCRQPGTHVRGCWVVDLVLNKR